jgi:hypothetical protein
MLGTWMCLLLMWGYERKKRYVSMRCITKFMRGEKQYGVSVVDEGCEAYFCWTERGNLLNKGKLVPDGDCTSLPAHKNNDHGILWVLIYHG